MISIFSLSISVGYRLDMRSGEGTGSETGDYPTVTTATLAARSSHPNGAGPPASNEEETGVISPSTPCAVPLAVDQQYKTNNETGNIFSN